MSNKVFFCDFPCGHGEPREILMARLCGPCAVHPCHELMISPNNHISNAPELGDHFAMCNTVPDPSYDHARARLDHCKPLGLSWETIVW